MESREGVLLNSMCREATEYIKPRLAEGVRCLFVSDVPDYYAVPLDKPCLMGVIDCLLDDAAKHTTEGFVALVLTERACKGWLTFSVTDTRRDMTERPSLFQCYLAMRSMGGFLWNTPNHENGWRVIFDIPLNYQP